MTFPYTTEVLREALKLTTRKAEIQSELNAIDRQINALGTGIRVPAAVASKAPAKKRGPKVKVAKAAKVAKTPKAPKVKSASLKTSILEILHAAGAGGIHAGEIAKKIGRKTSAVQVWFSTTGKSVPHLVKLAPATFAIQKPELATPAPVAPPVPPVAAEIPVPVTDAA